MLAGGRARPIGWWARVVLISVLIEGMAMFGALAYVGADLHARFGLGLGMIGALLAAFGAGALLFALNASWRVPKLGQSGLAAAAQHAAGECHADDP